MIKTYLITGFLGAGKTTFLNSLLKNYADKNNIVIENEFGETSIDTQLITEKVNQIIELTNGCICCSLDNELVDVLAQLIKNENKPDLLFIESTGIADPTGIISLFKTTEIRKYFYLAGTICLADSGNLEVRLKENRETGKQLAVSDILILNKISSTPPELLAQQIQLLKEINPFATLFKSTDGSINYTELSLALSHPPTIPSITELNSENNETKHQINSVLLETTDLFSLQDLTYTLNFNFLLYPNQLYRIKGFINGTDGKRYLLQSTGKTIQLTPIANARPNPISTLVFIGLQLKKETATRIVKTAMVKSGINLTYRPKND